MSEERNVDALFFLLRFARCNFHKNHTRTSYAKLVFLHLLGYADNIVHSSASGARNVYALFFQLEWDMYIFHKKCAGTRYAELVFLQSMGSAGHVLHSGASEP
jgi:hypothetical protein